MVYETGNNKGQIPSFQIFKYENNFILKHWTAFTNPPILLIHYIYKDEIPHLDERACILTSTIRSSSRLSPFGSKRVRCYSG